MRAVIPSRSVPYIPTFDPTTPTPLRVHPSDCYCPPSRDRIKFTTWPDKIITFSLLDPFNYYQWRQASRYRRKHPSDPRYRWNGRVRIMPMTILPFTIRLPIPPIVFITYTRVPVILPSCSCPPKWGCMTSNMWLDKTIV